MTKKILFVDDEQSLLNGVERRLGFDYDLTTANSGAAGLDSLRNSGPFAVVVTDMRMPNMDGVEFVKQARMQAPDTVYLMLTGNQDQATATIAVNEGQVFRFLNKPCDGDTLRHALDTALRQYELVTGEKELLQRTFCGAVGVLTDLLEISHPKIFSRSANVEEIVANLRESLQIEDRWEFRLASKLSLLGFALLTDDERQAFECPMTPESEWLDHLDKAAKVGQQLIQHIPRLELLASIIGKQTGVDGNAKWLGLEHKNEVEEAGATLLRIALHADRLAHEGVEAAEGVREIYASLPGLAIELEEAIEVCWPDTSSQPTNELAFADLAAGMVLAESITSESGSVLIRKGRRLTETIITNLRCSEKQLRKGGHAVVYEQSLQPTPVCEASAC